LPKGGYHSNIYKWKMPEGSIYLCSKISANKDVSEHSNS